MKTIIAKKQNIKGVTYSIMREGETFGVWKLCGNYCRSTAGGIRYVWRYIERGMTREAAENLFERRAK